MGTLAYFSLQQPLRTVLHPISFYIFLVLELKHIAQWVPLPKQIHARPFLSNSDLRALFYLELEIN